MNVTIVVDYHNLHLFIIIIIIFILINYGYDELHFCAQINLHTLTCKYICIFNEISFELRTVGNNISVLVIFAVMLCYSLLFSGFCAATAQVA